MSDTANTTTAYPGMRDEFRANRDAAARALNTACTLPLLTMRSALVDAQTPEGGFQGPVLTLVPDLVSEDTVTSLIEAGLVDTDRQLTDFGKLVRDVLIDGEEAVFDEAAYRDGLACRAWLAGMISADVSALQEAADRLHDVAEVDHYMRGVRDSLLADLAAAERAAAATPGADEPHDLRDDPEGLDAFRAQRAALAAEVGRPVSDPVLTAAFLSGWRGGVEHAAPRR